MNKKQEIVENKIFKQNCKKLLNEDGIRFVGIINSMGRQIAGGYKEGIVPLVDEEGHKMCIHHTLGLFLTNDLDKSLGSVEYITAKREKVVMITIPLDKYIILISTEHNINSEEIVEKVTKLQF